MNAALIEDYALIGDLHTAALISREGSIDWLCLPHFDDPACFASLLHDDSAGHWSPAPRRSDAMASRCYEEGSLILRTRWETSGGVAEVIDFMPPRGDAADLIRMVEGVSGELPLLHDDDGIQRGSAPRGRVHVLADEQVGLQQHHSVRPPFLEVN